MPGGGDLLIPPDVATELGIGGGNIAYNTNSVSLVDESKTDAELVADARKLVKGMCTHLDEATFTRLWDILAKHSKCWLRPRIGQVKAKARFRVEGKPHKARLKPIRPELQSELDRQVDDMLGMGVIVPSESPWGARPVFVKKKTGEWRVCIDYREVNKCMTLDAYPIPNLWEQVQQAAGHKYYICLDCNQGFFNVPLEEESQPLTAFVSKKGTFQYTVVPFGVKNSPIVFQRIMDQIFAGIIGNGVSVYIDDIVIYANDLDVLFERLEQVLDRCCAEGLYLKLKKGEYLKDWVKMLGYLVSSDGIRLHPSKVEAIRQVPAPKNIQELRSFLGAATYLKKHIPSFAHHTAILTDLLKKGRLYSWDESHEAAFQAIKRAIMDATMLKAPQGKGRFVITTDASDKAIGAILEQEQDGERVPIEFGSRKLQPAEQRWDTRERELYAIRYFVDKWHHYLCAAPFLVRTDHQNLKYLSKADTGKLGRWSLFLQQYDFQVEYVKGEDNVVADWLSRTDLLKDVDEDDLIESISCSPGIALQATDEPKGLQALDDEDATARTLVERGQDGWWFKKGTNRLYVPHRLRRALFDQLHFKSGAHPGVHRMRRQLQAQYFWPNLCRDIEQWTRECLLCARLNLRPTVAKDVGSLSRPFFNELISLDLIGPRAVGGVNYHIVVVIDHATRYLQAQVIRDKSAQTVRDFAVTHWQQYFGVPIAVLVDGGSEFKSQFFQLVMNEWRSKLYVTSPYRPQGNGVNESSHRALSKALQGNNPTTFVELKEALAASVLAHNSIPHPATGLSPIMALIGTEARYSNEVPLVYQEQARLDALRELRFPTALQLTSEVFHREPDLPKGQSITDFPVGSVVLYKLNEKSPKSHQGAMGPFVKQPIWSVPCVVSAHEHGSLHVNPVGTPGAPTARVSYRDATQWPYTENSQAAASVLLRGGNASEVTVEEDMSP
ncbi:putative Pol polyprotein, partial [Gregarina niphandrodes]